MKPRSSRRFLHRLPLRSFNVALTTSTAVVLFSGLAQAQTWNGGGSDNNWGTAANWAGGISPVPSATTDISFGGTTRLTPTNNYTAYDDFRNILFNSGAGAFTLSGSAIDLFGKIENNSTTGQTVNFTAIALNSASANEFNPVSGNLTINSADIFTNGNQLKVFGTNTLTFGTGSIISMGGSVSMNAAATVIYQSAHTYSGDTFVNAGKLQFNTGASANNSTIRIGDTAVTAVNAEVDLLPLTGGLTLSSVFNSRAGNSGTATIDSRNTSGTNTLSNQIALDKALTITQSGVVGTGTLAITQARAGGVGGTTGTDIKGFALTLNVANLGNAISYSGDIYNSTGSGNVTKSGNGLLTLSGTNTYTGLTTISAGILRLVGGAAIADAGAISSSAGGLLDLNGTSETIGSLTASAGSISLGSAALTLSSNNASSITGLVSGTSGSLVKQGSGVMTLGTLQGSSNSFASGNLFSGGITHSAGTLTISTANASGTGLITAASTLNISQAQFLLSGGITVNGGTTTLSATNAAGTGTLTLNTGGTLAITSAAAGQLASVVLAGGTFTTPVQAVTFGSLAGTQGFTAGAFGLTFGTNNTSATYSGNIAGAVGSNISKTGSGTQVLNGSNATTGSITVGGRGGTLEIGGQYTGSGAVAVSAGTLKLNFGTNNTTTTDMVKSAALSISGGTLSVVGQNTATNVIQNFTGTTTTAGTSSTISAINGSSTGTTAVNIGAITRGAGSVINFGLPSGTQSATNGILTSTGAAGIFVGTGSQAYATVNGTDFAAKDAGNTFVQALGGTVNATGGASLTGTATHNANITGGNIAVSGASTINTVRFNDAAARTLTLGGALTVTNSGILVSSDVTSAGSKITGSGITSATDVIIHQFSAQPFTLDSAVTGGGVILSKAGPGTLILTKANTNSGLTYVASGTLQIGTGGSLSSSVLSLAPNDPTAVFDVNNKTTSVANISGGGATGGYVNLGSTGNLSIVGGNGSFTNGALVGGVDSVLNKGSNTSSQGFQGSSNAAFYGTANVTNGSLGFFAGGSSFINGKVVLGASGSINMGGSASTLTFGSISGSGTLGGASNASSNGSYSVGYLGSDTTFSGTIINGTGAPAGTVGLTKFGSGTTILSGANTYTGTTTINSGGLTFDYATNVPLSTGALTVGGGTATFLGKASGATAISTGTFGLSNSVLSKVTVNASTGTGTTLTLKTAVVNSVVTLGSSNANNNLLFDLSSSGSNVLLTDVAIGAAAFTASDTTAIRTNNGLLTTGGTLNTNYRADVLIKDSTGIGFAQASGTTISRYTAATTLTGANAGTTLLETANYKISNSTLTRTAAAFLYNTLELDSSAAPAALVSSVDTFTRFGAGVASVSGRGVLATGSNGASITSGGGTNQPTFFNNYQTGTTAGQTLTLNMTLAGSSIFNGTGLTVATGLVGTGDQVFQSGVTRLTGTQSSGDALTAGGGVYRLVGGILEIGADLTGSTSPTSTADFSRTVGTNAGQVSLLGDTGFSASGGNRIVNLGGAGQQLVWGTDNFMASTAGGTTEGNNTFKLSSAFADSTVEIQNAIAFGSITRQVDVTDGSATVDAKLSGVLSGVLVPTVTLSNSGAAIANAAAGLTKLGAGTLELSGMNTYKGPTTVSAGTLRTTGGSAISDGSAIRMANTAGAILDLNGTNETVGSLTGGGISGGNITLDSATLTVGGDGTSPAAYNGAISGTNGSLTKINAGIQILGGTNTYTGTTIISAGTLRVAGGSAIANTSAVSLADAAGAILDLNGTTETIGSLTGGGALGGNVTLGAGALTVGGDGTSPAAYNGVISGTNGSLTKINAGIQILGGTNTYTGTTTISAGTLLINGTNSGSGAVDVGASGKLGGTGTIAGGVNVTGVLSPGASIESLAMGTVAFATGSQLTYELQDSSSIGADLVDITGDLSLTGTVTLDLVTLGAGTWAVGDKLTLLSYTGSITANSFFSFDDGGDGKLTDDETFSFDGAQWVFDYNDLVAGSNYSSESSGNFVTMTVIPEPNAATLVGGLGVLALFRRRRNS